MNNIISSLLVMSIISFIFTIIIILLNKVFFIRQDEKILKIRKALPGANCGACGFVNCDLFAAAVNSGKAAINGCKVGGQKTADALGEIVGKKSEKMIKSVAKLKCNAGSDKAKFKAEYEGIATCNAANLVGSGFKSCKYGCLGLGDCVNVCKFDALTLDKNNLPINNYNNCTACGLCVKICPKQLFHLVHVDNKVHVACVSHDKNTVIMKNCTAGCIACRICEKTCKFDAIHVNDNLASINYDKCTSCGDCVKKCPRKIILQVI